MPNRAKAYIAVIVAAGISVLAVGGLRWSPENAPRFALFILLALIASTMKVRLPGFTGTVAPNFVFIMIGMAQFSFSETALVGFGGAVVQSLWKPQRRPKPVQLLFNVSCLTVSSAGAYWISHFVAGALGSNSLVAVMALGGCFFLVLNTGLVSMVVSLAEEKPLRQVWQNCYEWVFPYFLVGGAVAGLASGSGRAAGWRVSLLVLPVMYFVYVYYRLRLSRATCSQLPVRSEDEEELLVAASRER